MHQAQSISVLLIKVGKNKKKTNLTIQEKIEESLSKVANESVKTICSGRTDSGVHASMQVIHFETSANRLNKAWLAGCNSILPQDISINWIKKVPEDFHSRFQQPKGLIDIIFSTATNNLF